MYAFGAELRHCEIQIPLVSRCCASFLTESLCFTLISLFAQVQESLVAAKAGKPLADHQLTDEVYSTADLKTEPQTFIRMPDYHNSIGVKL